MVSESRCAGVTPTPILVVGEDGLFVFDVDLDFFLELALHASQVSV